MNDYIKINVLRYQNIQKCSSCHRVKDIFYNAIIFDYEENDLQVGDMQLCKQCGDNLNLIIGNEAPLGEKVIKTFTFNK